jgi:hypothetical protein
MEECVRSEWREEQGTRREEQRTRCEERDESGMRRGKEERVG